MSAIPMDPVDVADLPPVDRFACSTCDGTGGVPSGEWDPWRREPDWEICPDCGGLGDTLGEDVCCHPGAPCDDCAYDIAREQRMDTAS